MKSQSVRICAGVASVVLAGFVIAQVTADDKKTDSQSTHHFRASKIDGMKVRNSVGEDLGSVKDLVVDLGSGKVVYAALDFGGFLGIGDKLFAVPWHAFKYHSEGTRGNEYLMLDVSKQRLKDAPGFDKSHWPDMGNSNWSRSVDQFYEKSNKTTTQR